jgi:spermidine synthase
MDDQKRLLLAVFISGACSLLVEIAGARLMAPYIGTTIYTWAAVIGFVLASLSFGYYYGGILADRYNDRKHLSLIMLCAGISTILLPFLGLLILPFTLVLDIAIASLVGALVLVPASFFYGMVSPFAIKLISKKGEEGKSSGEIFAVSTVGSLAGAIGTGFVLIPNMQISFIFILASFLMLLSSWLAGGFGRKSVIDVLPFFAIALLIINIPLAPPIGGTVVFEGDSEYYHIRVIDREYNGKDARILFLDNAASSGETASGEPVFNYMSKVRLALEPAGNVSRALVVGSAAGTQMEELKRLFPQAMVDGVEIDPKTVEVGKEYFSLEEDERTTIIIDDGRRYMQRTDERYGIVLLDAFRGMSFPYHLATKEYFSLLKEKLSPDGLVVANVISAVDGPDSYPLRYLHSSFSVVFDNVIVMPVGDDTRKLQNVVLIATDRDMTDFIDAHPDDIYKGEIEPLPPLTDELNPIELYVRR